MCGHVEAEFQGTGARDSDDDDDDLPVETRKCTMVHGLPIEDPWPRRFALGDRMASSFTLIISRVIQRNLVHGQVASSQ